MKPGNVVKVVPKESWQKYAHVFLNKPTIIVQGDFPEKRKIQENEIGFIVSESNDKETMFDWLVEVAFPDSNLQGWVSKDDLVLVSL